MVDPYRQNGNSLTYHPRRQAVVPPLTTSEVEELDLRARLLADQIAETDAMRAILEVQYDEATTLLQRGRRDA